MSNQGQGQGGLIVKSVNTTLCRRNKDTNSLTDQGHVNWNKKLGINPARANSCLIPRSWSNEGETNIELFFQGECVHQNLQHFLLLQESLKPFLSANISNLLSWLRDQTEQRAKLQGHIFVKRAQFSWDPNICKQELQGPSGPWLLAGGLSGWLWFGPIRALGLRASAQIEKIIGYLNFMFWYHISYPYVLSINVGALISGSKEGLFIS